MKNNKMKKVATVLTTAMLTAAMAIPVLADTNGIENVSGNAWQTSFTNTFTISQGDDANNLPAATFDFEIAPGQGAPATATTPKINAGLAGAWITDPSHPATDAGDTVDSQTVTADFSGCNFSSAGIYRYIITESSDVASNVSQDIVIDIENGNSGSYVMDVYVKKSGNGFDVVYSNLERAKMYEMAEEGYEVPFDKSLNPYDEADINAVAFITSSTNKTYKIPLFYYEGYERQISFV